MTMVDYYAAQTVLITLAIVLIHDAVLIKSNWAEDKRDLCFNSLNMDLIKKRSKYGALLYGWFYMLRPNNKIPSGMDEKLYRDICFNIEIEAVSYIHRYDRKGFFHTFFKESNENGALLSFDVFRMVRGVEVLFLGCKPVTDKALKEAVIDKTFKQFKGEVSYEDLKKLVKVRYH